MSTTDEQRPNEKALLLEARELAAHHPSKDCRAFAEQVAELLAASPTAAPREPAAPVDARDDYSQIIKSLAAIINVNTPDKLFDLEAIPREPVMVEVVRIRDAARRMLAALARQAAAPEGQE